MKEFLVLFLSLYLWYSNKTHTHVPVLFYFWWLDSSFCYLPDLFVEDIKNGKLCVFKILEQRTEECNSRTRCLFDLNLLRKFATIIIMVAIRFYICTCKCNRSILYWLSHWILWDKSLVEMVTQLLNIAKRNLSSPLSFTWKHILKHVLFLWETYSKYFLVQL